MAIGEFDGSARERLSALVDGELAAGDSAACFDAWRREDELRADWHAWHLIGDALRSEDLACDPDRDRRLLAAVRSRLEAEPVVLAPVPARGAAVPLPATRGRRFDVRSRPGRWSAGAAVAAGLVLVVGTFALVRPGESPVPAQLARGDAAPVSVPAPARAPALDTLAPPVELADNRLVRDVRLDRYLEAHKQFAGTSALGVPSAFLRSATVESASR